MAARSPRADELHHLGEAPSDPTWSETFGLDFVADDGAIGGYVIVTLRPSEGRAWFWAAVAGPERAVVAIDEPDTPLPRRAPLELRASGLWVDVECETPFEHVSLGLEAFGVAFDDPRDAVTSGRGERTPVGFDLEWETSGARDAGAPSSFRIECTVSGEVLVGTERVELDGTGRRWHRWGPQPVWSPEPAPPIGAGEPIAEVLVEVPTGGVLRSTVHADHDVSPRWAHAVSTERRKPLRDRRDR